MIYESLFKTKPGKKCFAVLADPEKLDQKALKDLAIHSGNNNVDMILIGGSLVSAPLEEPIMVLKQHTNIPIVLFPGNPVQISSSADGILLLSLISGRNPEHLIGNHVVAAPILSRLSLEIISTGYILVGGAGSTSVGYLSNTNPIPSGKTDLVVATALAGEMLGFKTIYLESGSGARTPLDKTTIRSVKEQISIPLIVGGGIRSADDARKAYTAGADMLVIGNAIEEKISLIEQISSIKQEF